MKTNTKNSQENQNGHKIINMKTKVLWSPRLTLNWENIEALQNLAAESWAVAWQILQRCCSYLHTTDSQQKNNKSTRLVCIIFEKNLKWEYIFTTFTRFLYVKHAKILDDAFFDQGLTGFTQSKMQCLTIFVYDTLYFIGWNVFKKISIDKRCCSIY